jgi:lysophospholipase L1-like esterase
MIITKNDMRDDGIHPTDAGYDKIGKAVFDLMVKEGMRR